MSVKDISERKYARTDLGAACLFKFLVEHAVKRWCYLRGHVDHSLMEHHCYRWRG